MESLHLVTMVQPAREERMPTLTLAKTRNSTAVGPSAILLLKSTRKGEGVALQTESCLIDLPGKTEEKDMEAFGLTPVCAKRPGHVNGDAEEGEAPLE